MWRNYKVDSVWVDVQSVRLLFGTTCPVYIPVVKEE